MIQIQSLKIIFRSLGVKIHKGKSKRLIKLFLIASVTFFMGTMGSAKEDWRCGVRLAFDSDGSGSVANYILGLQVKNTTGRNINGVSVIYKDSDKNVLGNSLLNCSVGSEHVKPGSYGECSRVIQSVDENYTKTLTKEKWRDIVDYQLEKLRSVNYCHVLGFSY